jgi:hypothetical protein
VEQTGNQVLRPELNKLARVCGVKGHCQNTVADTTLPVPTTRSDKRRTTADSIACRVNFRGRVGVQLADE